MPNSYLIDQEKKMKSIKDLISLKGRVSLVTGASGNLGRVISETFAELDADLIIVDINQNDLTEFKDFLIDKYKIKVTEIKCDLENEKERLSLIKKILMSYSQLNIIVNNAAFVGSSDLQGWNTTFERQEIDSLRRALEINLTAPFHIAQGLAPLLRKSVGANIINIGSIYGELAPDWELYKNTLMSNPAGYAASKGGLSQITRWLSTTMAPEIRVNTIAPGGIYRNQPEIFVNKYINKTPLRRMANEEDFKGAIAFLGSDMSNYVTGHTLLVDGGWSAW